MVDEDNDLYDGEPTSYFVVTPMDKYRLAYRFREDEEKAEAILRLSDDKTAYSTYGFQGQGLQVYTYEGWHVPSGKGAPDGRYTLAVGNCTLIDRVWDGGPRNKPPIANMQWSEGLAGFYGQGIAEQGKAIQSEINAIVRQIQNGHHLVTGQWLVEANSKVVSAHINNDLSSILRYFGTAPQYIVPTIIAPEMYQHLIWLVGKYYDLAALNQQMTAAGDKPAGLDSGEAQRVYADQQTETLLEKGKRYEEFVKECGQLVTDAAKELAEHGSYEVRAASDDAFETIDWKELDDPDGYQLRVAPTSGLPGTPSGKIDFAYDLMKLGDFDTNWPDIMENVGMPDMLQKTRQKLASRKLDEKKVGEMLRLGVAWAPHPLLNLDEAIASARDMCNLAESKEVDDGKLQLVRDFIDACVKLKPAGARAAPAASDGPWDGGDDGPWRAWCDAPGATRRAATAGGSAGCIGETWTPHPRRISEPTRRAPICPRHSRPGTPSTSSDSSPRRGIRRSKPSRASRTSSLPIVSGSAAARHPRLGVARGITSDVDLRAEREGHVPRLRRGCNRSKLGQARLEMCLPGKRNQPRAFTGHPTVVSTMDPGQPVAARRRVLYSLGAAPARHG